MNISAGTVVIQVRTGNLLVIAHNLVYGKMQLLLLKFWFYWMAKSLGTFRSSSNERPTLECISGEKRIRRISFLIEMSNQFSRSNSQHLVWFLSNHLLNSIKCIECMIWWKVKLTNVKLFTIFIVIRQVEFFSIPSFFLHWNYAVELLAYFEHF